MNRLLVCAAFLCLCLMPASVHSTTPLGCYDNWSRCTPQTAFATGILWKSCEERCNKCLGRESGECVQVHNRECSGGYQCHCKGGSVTPSSNPIIIATCKLGL